MTIRGLSRRLVTLTGGVAILAGGLAVAGAHASAGYTSSCAASDFGSPIVYTAPGPAHVYAGTGGRTGAAAVDAGVCLDSQSVAGQSQGGDVEAGASATNGVVNGPTGPVAGIPGAYAIVDGADTNTNIPDPTGQTNGVGLTGYAGISNFESGSFGPGANDPAPNACGNGTGGTGSNAGGAVMAKPLCATWASTVGSVVPAWKYGLPLPIACGFTSGPDWDNTPRDGCFFP